MDQFSLFTENTNISLEEMRFIKMILDDPKNKHGYSLFANWLTENGEPKIAEAIAVQRIMELKSNNTDSDLFYKKREQVKRPHILNKLKIDSWQDSRIVVVPNQHDSYYWLVEPGKEIYVIKCPIGTVKFDFYYWKNTTNMYMKFALPKEENEVSEIIGREYGKLYFYMLYRISVYELPDDIAYYLFWQMMWYWSTKHIKYSLASVLDKL